MQSQRGKRADGGQWKVRQVSFQNEPDFNVFASEDTKSRNAQRVHMKNDNMHFYGVAKEDTLDKFGLGSVSTIPMRPAYACTVHKGQGLTIQVVYAILEGLFAHGQVYVQTSRTPAELNFLCVGLPPQDLFVEILEQVLQMQNVVQEACSTWESLQQDCNIKSVRYRNSLG